MTDRPIKKILLLATNQQTASAVLEEERRIIDEVLQRSKQLDQFEIKAVQVEKSRSLYKSLLSYKPQIVHFCGPSIDGDGLMVKDGAGRVKLFSATSLARVFSFPNIECVILNTDHLKSQAEAIAQHIPYVVCLNQTTMSVRTNKMFLIGFYDFVERGGSYIRAFEIGIAVSKVAGAAGSEVSFILKQQRSSSSNKNDSLRYDPTETDETKRYNNSAPTPYTSQAEQLAVSDTDRKQSNPCYVYAEMDEQVFLQRVTTLEVIITRNEIDFQTNSTAQGGKVNITSEKLLIIQIIPKTNFSIIDDNRIEIDPSSLDDTQRLYFDLKPTDLGEGEIWIIVRQGPMPLLTLTIKPQIVAFISTNQQPPNKVSTKGSIVDYPESTPPLHQLRIIEQRNGNSITYRYDFESPTLDILKSFESKPILSDRQEYVEDLYKEIEARWVSNFDDVEMFTEELRAFGGTLFDNLFPSELRELLWEYHRIIDSIMVLSTEPFIPWELIHLKQPGKSYLPDETIFLGQMGLVRWLYGSGRFPPETIEIQKGNIKYIIPHYPDSRYRLPQAEQESDFLEKTFQATSISPTSKSVQKILKQGSFDLLHFAGHGTAEHSNIGNSKLLMEGRIESSQYKPEYLSATVVEQNAQLTSRPMVVLNACQIGREGYTLTGIGGFAEAFLKGGAGAFVGPLWSVGDRPARMFTETLYKSLVEKQTLSQATTKARERAKESGDSTWLAYAVYGHPNLSIIYKPPYPKPNRIFLSYKRDVAPDEPVAMEIYEALQSDYQVFIDQNMLVGTPWEEHIKQQIFETDVLIVFLSEASINSEMILCEIELAIQSGQQRKGLPRIFPVRLAYNYPFSYPFNEYLNPINCASWENAEDTPQLITELQAALAGEELPINTQTTNEKLSQQDN